MFKIILNNLNSLFANYRNTMKIKINFLTIKNAFFYKSINTSLRSLLLILFATFATIQCETGVTDNKPTGNVTCTAPQVLRNGVCVTPETGCVAPQVLQDGKCVTPPVGSFALVWKPGFSSYLTVVKNQSISEIATVIHGTLASCSAPSLPQGLKFEKVGTGCLFSGTFTEPKLTTTYTFWASSTDGKTAKADLNITVNCLSGKSLVNGVCPFSINYPYINYAWGTNANVNIAPTVYDGVAISYNVNPVLPAWLNFSTVNGAITGNTPNSTFDLSVYTISAISTENLKATVNLGIKVVTKVDDDGNGLIEIYNLEQLNNIRNSLDGKAYIETGSSPLSSGCPIPAGENIGVCRGYELKNNLDFAGSRWAKNCSGASCVTGGWEPIGQGNEFFKAEFEGKSYTIQNLYINRYLNDVGFFGNVSGNVNISNIGLTNVTVTGSKDSGNVGGLVANITGSANITNSYVSGVVSGSGNNITIGGLLGSLNGTTITNSHFSGMVSGGNNTGGLVGFQFNGNITNSFATGSVSGLINVGGLVGDQLRGIISKSYTTNEVLGNGGNYYLLGGLVGKQELGSSITNSYAIGAVTAIESFNSVFVGGLVGEQSGSISKSFATGAVSGKSSDFYSNVGGLVGKILEGNISNSYATGVLTSNGNIDAFTGGLVGFKDGGTITSSYWATTASQRIIISNSNNIIISNTLVAEASRLGIGNEPTSTPSGATQQPKGLSKNNIQTNTCSASASDSNICGLGTDFLFGTDIYPQLWKDTANKGSGIIGPTSISVTNNGFTSYSFNGGSDNATISVRAGEIIALNLNVTGHPFRIKQPGATSAAQGTDISDTSGLLHIDTSGVVISTGIDALGKTIGTLYWIVPSSYTKATYRYQCSNHNGMIGDLRVE